LKLAHLRAVELGLNAKATLHNDYAKIDLSVVVMANLINVMMAFLFVARLSGLSQVQHTLGVITMATGFALGYIAFHNRKNRRDKWLTYLLLPIFVFFIVELFIDYIFTFDFRSTAIVGPYILLYYAGLWGLIGYAFKFDKKWGFATLATYFANMTMSILH
jgi:hypothetical protein